MNTGTICYLIDATVKQVALAEMLGMDDLAVTASEQLQELLLEMLEVHPVTEP